MLDAAMAELVTASDAVPWLRPTSLTRFAWTLVIRVRWVLLVTSTAIVGFNPRALWPATAFIAALAAYNAVLERVPVERARSLAVSLLPDLTVITLAVALLGGIATDAYLGYLYVLVTLAIAHGSRGVWLGAGAIALAYGGATLAATGSLDVAAVSRLAFRLLALAGTGAVAAVVVRQHETQVQRLEEARAHVEEAARSDPLTGLWNRRALYVRLDEEIARARRYGRPLAVLLLDMDHLKDVNDRSGHLAGDEALQAVAAVLRGALRATDQVYRYGGDEFVLLLPETPRAEAEVVAARVCRAVCGIAVHGTALSATVGVAACPDDGAAPRDLIAAADRALYAQKTT